MADLMIAIVIVLILILIFILSERDIDAEISDYIYGHDSSIYMSSGLTSMRIWSCDTTKLVIDYKSADNSKPVRLYFKYDPVPGDDIIVPRSTLLKRLSRLCNEDIGYNFANYQFDIKGKSVLDVIEKAINLRDATTGSACTSGSACSSGSACASGILIFKSLYINTSLSIFNDGI
jgi:hypothetical protein